ncbi:MAG: hypothetical protein K2H09_06590 [Treponemataceae bacterium]|nr:hypothetical protein [Treponemataceae bacterium]
MAKFLCVCLSATIQRTVTFRTVSVASVNRSESYREDASGKAVNAARVLNELEPGCAAAVCPLGAENGARFLNLARRDGLPVIAVETPGATRECWTLLDRMNGTTTELVVGEASGGFDFSAAEARLVEAVSGALRGADAVLLAGSRPDCWSQGLSTCIARMAVGAQKVLLADYCGADLERTLSVCTPAVIKINEEEFRKTFCGGQYLDESCLKAAVAEKSAALRNAVVVTRGSRSTYAAVDGAFTEFGVESVSAVNTTACGDAFAAGFLYEYVQSGDFSGALAKGTWCAARNAESRRPGSVASGRPFLR